MRLPLIIGTVVLALTITPAPVTAATGAPSCGFTFFNVDQRHVLTSVSQAKRLKKDQKWVFMHQVLREGTALLTGVEPARPAEAVKALSKQVGLKLAPLGSTYPPAPPGATSFSGAGRYVSFQTTRHLIDADVRYACGERTIGFGHLTTWQYTDASGVAQCGVDPRDRVARAALRLAC